VLAAEGVQTRSQRVVALAARDRTTLGRAVLTGDLTSPTGLEVSLCDLPQGVDLELLVGDDAL